MQLRLLLMRKKTNKREKWEAGGAIAVPPPSNAVLGNKSLRMRQLEKYITANICFRSAAKQI